MSTFKAVTPQGLEEGIAGGKRALTRRRDGDSLKICLTDGRPQASCRQFFGRVKTGLNVREQSPLVSTRPTGAASAQGCFQVETDGLCSFSRRHLKDV